MYKNSTAAILLYWLTSDLCQVDYAIDVYKQLHSDEEDPPEPQGNVHLKTVLTSLTLPLTRMPSRTPSHTEMTDRRREVVEKLHEFEQTIDPIVQLFEDPEVQEYVENRK